MEQIKQNILTKKTWLRILCMIIFYVIGKILWMLILSISVIQIISMLITGKVMMPVYEFSEGLNIYTKQIIDFLSFRSDDKPFPFTNWPHKNTIANHYED